MNEIEKILLELVERYPALDSCRGEIMEAYHEMKIGRASCRERVSDVV